MKRFLYTASVLVGGAVIALVVMGLFVDEVHYTATVRVRAPLAESWATFMDGDRLHEWLDGLDRIRLHFENGDSLLETVVSLTPEESYVFDMETDWFTGQTSVTFEPQEDYTRIQQAVVIRGSTFIARAIFPVFKPLIQRQQIDALDRLKEIIQLDPSPIITGEE